MQVTSRCHANHPPERLKKRKKETKDPSVGEGGGFVGENIDRYSRSAELSVCLYLRGVHMFVYQRAHAGVFTPVLQQQFVITPDWQLPTYPLLAGWVNKRVVHTKVHRTAKR